MRTERYQEVFSVVETALLEQIDLASLKLDRIEPNASIIDDLGVDSVDLLTAVYDIEVALAIKLPLNDWLAEHSTSAAGHSFTVEALVTKIVNLLHSREGADTAQPHGALSA